MEEEINALVEESAGSHTVDTGSVGLEAVAGCRERLQCLLLRQLCDPDDGYVGLEPGSSEARSQGTHELAQPRRHLIFRQESPDRVRELRGSDGDAEFLGRRGD